MVLIKAAGAIQVDSNHVSISNTHSQQRQLEYAKINRPVTSALMDWLCSCNPNPNPRRARCYSPERLIDNNGTNDTVTYIEWDEYKKMAHDQSEPEDQQHSSLN